MSESCQEIWNHQEKLIAYGIVQDELLTLREQLLLCPVTSAAGTSADLMEEVGDVLGWLGPLAERPAAVCSVVYPHHRMSMFALQHVPQWMDILQMPELGCNIPSEIKVKLDSISQLCVALAAGPPMP